MFLVQVPSLLEAGRPWGALAQLSKGRRGQRWCFRAGGGGGEGDRGEGGLIHKSQAAVMAAACLSGCGWPLSPPSSSPSLAVSPLPCPSPTHWAPWEPSTGTSGDIAAQHGGAGAPCVREARGDVGQMAAVLRHDSEDVVDGECWGPGPLCALTVGTQIGEGGQSC